MIPIGFSSCATNSLVFEVLFSETADELLSATMSELV